MLNLHNLGVPGFFEDAKSIYAIKKLIQTTQISDFLEYKSSNSDQNPLNHKIIKHFKLLLKYVVKLSI